MILSRALARRHVKALRRVIAGFCIAASVLTGVAWVVSYWRAYKLIRTDLASNGAYFVELRGGGFQFGRMTFREVPVGTPVKPWMTRSLGPYQLIRFENQYSDIDHLFTTNAKQPVRIRDLIFGSKQRQVRLGQCDGLNVRIWGVLSPLALLACFLILPDVRRTLTRRARRRRGACLKCGYDLTGNFSGQCSECGMHFERSASEIAVERSPSA